MTSHCRDLCRSYHISMSENNWISFIKEIGEKKELREVGEGGGGGEAKSVKRQTGRHTDKELERQRRTQTEYRKKKMNDML